MKQILTIAAILVIAGSAFADTPVSSKSTITCKDSKGTTVVKFSNGTVTSQAMVAVDPDNGFKESIPALNEPADVHVEDARTAMGHSKGQVVEIFAGEAGRNSPEYMYQIEETGPGAGSYILGAVGLLGRDGNFADETHDPRIQGVTCDVNIVDQAN